MMIYPAIDLKDGQCVRLLQGRQADVTVYGDDPVAMAIKWQQAGAQFLHLVDLDGAFSGTSVNLEVVTRIVQAVSIPTQLGGGIRSIADIEKRLDEVGVSRVILGTVAAENPNLVKEAAAKYKGRIVVGIDAHDGLVAVRGWVDKTNINPIDLAKRMKDVGITTLVYTDISKDGMMQGPNVEAIASMIQATGMDIIASGGVCSLVDILAVKAVGAQGAIIGKALYTGALTLQEALQAAQ